MADTKTADQWKQVAADARAQVPTARAEFDTLSRDRDDAIRKREELSKAARDFLAANPDAGTVGTPANAQARALRQEVNAQAAEVRRIEAARNQAGEKIQDLNRTAENADREAEKAAESPPGTIANPVTTANAAPASNDTSDPTKVNIPPGEDVKYTQESVNTDVPPPGEEVPPPKVNPPAQPTNEDPAVAKTEAPAPGTTAFDLANAEPQSEPVVAGKTSATNSGNTPRFEPFPAPKDYRVRISLAAGADYLYKATDPGILKPLVATNGVLFPYVPQIAMTYSAAYAPTDLMHTNYKLYNYQSSTVEAINITADFTAQDVTEANYILAAMHFFRSVTKMFYGNDQRRGVPPPLVYLSGHGEYGFDNHPMVISSFNYTWPNDVDYINAGPLYNVSAVLNTYRKPSQTSGSTQARLASAKLEPGGLPTPPKFGVPTNTMDVTRIPTKIQFSIAAWPIITRDSMSNYFSLDEYATGNLLRGSKRQKGGGIW